MHKPDKIEKQILRDCRRFVFPALLFYTSGSLISSLITVYTAGTLGRFADAVFRLDLQSGLADFRTLLLCVLANIFVEPLLSYVCGDITMTVCSLRHDRQILRRFLDKTYASAMSIDAGEANARIENDPIELRCDWEIILDGIIQTTITLVYLLYSSLRISALFTVIVLAISALKLTVPVLVRKAQARFKLQEKEYRTTLRSYETEITVQPHTVILYGLKNAMLARLDRLYRTHYENVVRKSSRYNTVADNILSWLNTFCILLILFTGALMVSRGSITAGNVAAMVGYFAAYNQLMEMSGSIIRTIPVFRDDVRRVRFLYEGAEDLSGETIPAETFFAEPSAGAERDRSGKPNAPDAGKHDPAEACTQTEACSPMEACSSAKTYSQTKTCSPTKACSPTENYSPAEARSPVPSQDLLRIDNLSFRYDGQPVLNGLSFSVKKGEKIAVTGPNGSGKSTLLRILCGLYRSYDGSVRITGKELKELNPEAWRDCFALVQQDPWLFEGDVAENVQMGRLSASRDDVYATMDRLGIRYLAERKLSFQDHSLSGGEKQRISIARALLKGCGLLLFDEPNNNLDAATSAWIGRFIETCPETVIFISHDEALIAKADRIVAL